MVDVFRLAVGAALFLAGAWRAGGAAVRFLAGLAMCAAGLWLMGVQTVPRGPDDVVRLLVFVADRLWNAALPYVGRITHGLDLRIP